MWLFKQSILRCAEQSWEVFQVLESALAQGQDRQDNPWRLLTPPTTLSTPLEAPKWQFPHGSAFSQIITLYFYWAWFSPHTLLLTSRSRGGSLTGQENLVSSCARAGLYLIYREYFFTERAVQNWNNWLPRAVMESMSLKVFKNR